MNENVEFDENKVGKIIYFGEIFELSSENFSINDLVWNDGSFIVEVYLLEEGCILVYK